jgi:anti-sigma factor RsiW
VAHVAAAVCLLGAGAVGGWVVRDRQAPPPSAALVRQAAEAHRVYVVEVRHPVEVEASEEAHLVTWLSRRLGHPVKAPFLGDLGFTLVGGRLLPADGKPAAQFMYETLSGRRLTLFVRQLPGSAETAFRFTEDGGVRMFYWVDGPLGYALIGDVERDRLLSLARTVYTQLTP